MISTVRLALIRGISDGTRVRGRDDKISERQPIGAAACYQTHPDRAGVGRQQILKHRARMIGVGHHRTEQVTGPSATRAVGE